MSGRHFTKAEDDYLLRTIGKVSLRTAAKKLGRTENSVRSHLFHLGETVRGQGYLSARELTAMAGVSKERVLGMLRRGEIVAERRKGSGHWLITPEEAERAVAILQVPFNHITTPKLTEEQVLAIRSDPRSNTKIAAEYGVCAETIGRIKRHEDWKHLKPRPWYERDRTGGA